MGQSSIPTLNRSGYSMFWTSVWENKHMYTSLFKEDTLIRKYITLLLNEKISTHKTNLNINKINQSNWVKTYNIKFDFSSETLFNVLQRFNKLPIYISKIHIIRLNNWVVVYFVAATPNTSMYIPNSFKFKSNLTSISEKKYLIYLHNYLNSF